MSGHNPPHSGRLGQPNTSWNPLQVPSYVPRQPQLAHMSSERPMVRSPLTWHTPPNHQDKMYRCTAGNLMNNLEMNPLLQGYGRNIGMPQGSVDLSLSAASRSTPSPKSTHPIAQSTSLAPQTSQAVGSSSTALPSNIPTSSVYNLAGDHSTNNNQIRTSSSSSNPSGGVIQSINAMAGLKERMQGACYVTPVSGNSTNCIGSTNALSDSNAAPVGTSISGENGFAANVGSRVNDLTTTLVTGGLLIKDAKQINSEMDSKNSRDCFPHLPAADSAELVKEFIMQTMQHTNAHSVSPKRVSPMRSMLQTNLSPARSRSPTLNMLLGSSSMDGKLGMDCILSVPNANSAAPLIVTPESKALAAATESTDSGNSSSAAISIGSLLSRGGGGVTTGGMPSNNPSASPTNNSITSSEDSVDSLNSRNNARRRRKPERTSKMNAHEEHENDTFFSVAKASIDGTLTDGLVEPPSLRSTNAVRSDISALAMEGINALRHALAGNNGTASPYGTRLNSNPAHSPHDGQSFQQQQLHGNVIQSNSNNNTTKTNSSPSLTPLPLGDSVVCGTDSAGNANEMQTGSNSIPTRDVSPANADMGSDLHKEKRSTKGARDPDHVGDSFSAKAAVNAGSKGIQPSVIQNGNDTDPTTVGAARSCNGPMQQKTAHQQKHNVHKQGDKSNASDSSYEEVENKLEEMFAGIEEEQSEKISAGTSVPDKPRINANNGRTDYLTEERQPTPNARVSSGTVTDDGDVLKQLSSDATGDARMQDISCAGASGDAAVDESETRSGKKPLTPAQKRGNGTAKAALAQEMRTSTPATAAKRKRGPKKKSNSHGNPCIFPEFEGTPGLPVGLRGAASAKKKKGKSNGPAASGSGKKKGKEAAKGKGGNGKSKRAPSSAAVCSVNAPSIDTNGKYKGPYVQVKSDGSHMVVNTPINDEDGEKGGQNKTKKFGNSSLNSSERSKIRGLHVSTLSTKYDADTTDMSWMCVFCKTGPHKFRLGDLFGPYIISTTSSEFQQSQVDVDFFSVKRTRESLESLHAKEQKQQKLQELSGPKSKKRKNAAASTTVVSTASSPGSSRVATMKEEKNTSEQEQQQQQQQQQQTLTDMFYGMIKAGESTYEVWTHEDCLVWAPGVYMVGTRIVGLEAAIWNCCRHQCKLCRYYGAVVSCLRQGCSAKAHFICAHKLNWKMTQDFQSFCETHAAEGGELTTAALPDGTASASAVSTVDAHQTKQLKKEFKPDKSMVNLSSNVS